MVLEDRFEAVFRDRGDFKTEIEEEWIRDQKQREERNKGSYTHANHSTTSDEGATLRGGRLIAGSDELVREVVSVLQAVVHVRGTAVLSNSGE
jgi:hypothetical protein